jgi:hypothetical protein
MMMVASIEGERVGRIRPQRVVRALHQTTEGINHRELVYTER